MENGHEHHSHEREETVPGGPHMEDQTKDRMTGHALHGPEEEGHGSHHEHMVTDFRRRFWISLVATVPVLILSPMIQEFLGIAFEFPGDGYILFAISSFAAASCRSSRSTIPSS